MSDPGAAGRRLLSLFWLQREKIGSFFFVSIMVTAGTESEYFCFLHPDLSFLSSSRLVGGVIYVLNCDNERDP